MMNYEQAKQLARSGTWEERSKLAGDENLPAELQVFLAADSSEGVRVALADNKKLPSAAVRLLARDAILAVRETVARQVARLWPERTSREPETAHRLAREALMLLATDKAITVRTALATAIADIAVAPPELAEALALDAAQEVAEPILRQYAKFEDRFLIDALAKRSETWARIAIAERKAVSHAVGDALIALNDDSLLEVLLQNAGANLSDVAYELITHKAQSNPDWQKILVSRHDIRPPSLIRLAEYIDQSLYTTLAARGDFDPDTLKEIVAVARRRVDWAESGQLPAILRVREMLDEGKLNDDAIRDALAWRDEEFVQLALAVLARIPPDKIAEIMKSSNPKAVVAVSWKAGLSARTSLALQKAMGGLAPHQYLHPRGGTDYPLSDEEMIRQLEFYDINA